MIPDAIVSIVFGFLSPLVNLVSWGAAQPGDPDWTPGQIFAEGVAHANRYMPVDTILALITAGAAFDLLATSLQIGMFLYRAIPLKAT